MCGGKSLRTRHRPPGGAPTASHRPPTASPRRARGSPGHARAAQQRPRAPGGLRRALTGSTAIYMRLRPTYTPRLANRGRRSRPPALAPARARSAHRLPSARCYPGPAGASAGGDLSARRLTKAAALRLRDGGHAEKVPSRAAQPRPIGTCTCSIAARSCRAYKRAQRPRYARTVEDTLGGLTWLEACLLT